MLATLLDLVDRGYYHGKASEGEELDLRLSIPEDPSLDDLTEYEREALEFFDGLLEEGPADLGRLKDRVPSTRRSGGRSGRSSASRSIGPRRASSSGIAT